MVRGQLAGFSLSAGGVLHSAAVFFLSGVFFKTTGTFAETAIGKADALLKPFFFTMLLYVVVRDVLRGQPCYRIS